MKRLNRGVLLMSFAAFLMLALALVPAAEASAGVISKAEDGFQFTSDGSGATVMGYTGSATNIAIPSTHGGVPVVAIGVKAFQDRNLVSVSIPGSVKQIDEKAFYNCGSLASVTLVSGLQKIGYDAFAYCGALKDVAFPGTLKEIGAWAFFRCDSLTDVELTSGIETLGDYAFFYDKALTSASIPGTVKEIGEKVFSDCSNLTDLTLGSGIEKVGSEAFANCSALKSVSVPGSVKEIGDYAFSGCGSLENVVLTSGLESIGERAFFCAYALTGITIPSTVKEIGERAFSDDTKLASVTLPSGLETIGYGAFANCYALKSVAIPGTVKSIGPSNFTYTYGTYGVFSNCTNLASVTLSSGTEIIGSQAFYGCTALTGVTIPDSVTSIRESAFGSCSALVKTALSRNLTEIRGFAFYGCKLSSMTLYDKLETLGYRAFANCQALKSVTLYAKDLTFGNEVFYGCPADLVLRGYAGSNTQDYADSCGIDFEALGSSKVNFGMSPVSVKPGLNNPVTFTIENAWRAARARLVIDGARYSDEAEVSPSGSATVRLTFHTSGTRRILLQLYINGAWVDGGAGTKALKVKSASKLATPSFTRPSGGTLYITPGSGAVVAWKGVKKAERYEIAVYNSANACVWMSSPGGTGVSIPSSAFGATGSYRVKIYALGNDVQQSGTRACTVNAVGNAALGTSLSTVNPGINNPVTFSISGATGATKARLAFNGDLTDAVAVSGKTHAAIIRKALYVSGVYSVQLQLYRNGVWEDGGADARMLTVNNAEKLATPVMTKPAGGTLRVARKKDASIAWTGVTGAKMYLVCLYDAGNARVWATETAKLSAKIPKSALARKGSYRAEVYALGDDVQRSAPGAACTITVS